jgi:acyl transferase domain-containing protein
VIAHRLDLRGPSVTVQSASSTSLTAVALAVQAIRSGLCDLALAGGASVTVPVRSGHLHEDGAMFSRDGTTRPFDADASGTVFSDGAAVVLLKRLEDARADGDRILAVIRGVGVTNDGAARASFSAPTVEGQALCISRALADAGWTADQISYVETHGTATPLGDPIEIEGLKRAFAETTDRKRFCLVGSLKSNIGHLTAAAGVAGLIKTVLAMGHRYLPPTLHFRAPNPRIDFTDGPFLVARLGAPWQSDAGPLRAGVSSFGAGGTNVHVVLEEWIAPPVAETDTRLHLLPVSARSAAALVTAATRLAHALETSGQPLGWVARTLREGRKAHPVRATVVAGDRGTAVQGLRRLAADPGALTPAREAPAVVLLFPGQGAQYPGMADAVCAAYPQVRGHLDHCAELLGPLEGRDLRDWISGRGASPDQAAAALQDTRIAQPALFAVEYALARTLMDWGLEPAGMVGHSIGELTAACLAGVMDLATALRVVARRGHLMGEMPRGAMLSVRAAAEDVEPLLPRELVIAAVNAPRLCVVSGPEQAVRELQDRLSAQDIAHRVLKTSHAFHSPMMDPAMGRFEAFLDGVALGQPSLPFIACPTGRVATTAEVTTPRYWARQMREAVRFMDGIRHLASERTIFLEVGPRATLTALVRQTLPGRVRAVAALDPADEAHEAAALLAALGRLWCWGTEGLDWNTADPVPHWRRVALPTYPFERTRHWIEPGRAAFGAEPPPVPQSGGADAQNGGSWGSLIAGQLALIRNQQAILERLRQDH